jgi:hypothetical protein
VKGWNGRSTLCHRLFACFAVRGPLHSLFLICPNCNRYFFSSVGFSTHITLLHGDYLKDGFGISPAVLWDQSKQSDMAKSGNNGNWDRPGRYIAPTLSNSIIQATIVFKQDISFRDCSLVTLHKPDERQSPREYGCQSGSLIVFQRTARATQEPPLSWSLLSQCSRSSLISKNSILHPRLFSWTSCP